MDTESFIFHIKSDDAYEDLVEGVETRFDISNYEVKIHLPIGKNRKIIRLMKDELI